MSENTDEAFEKRLKKSLTLFNKEDQIRIMSSLAREFHHHEYGPLFRKILAEIKDEG